MFFIKLHQKFISHFLKQIPKLLKYFSNCSQSLASSTNENRLTTIELTLLVIIRFELNKPLSNVSNCSFMWQTGHYPILRVVVCVCVCVELGDMDAAVAVRKWRWSFTQLFYTLWNCLKIYENFFVTNKLISNARHAQTNYTLMHLQWEKLFFEITYVEVIPIGNGHDMAWIHDDTVYDMDIRILKSNHITASIK